MSLGALCGKGTRDPESVLSKACGYKGRCPVPLHVLSSCAIPPAYGPSVKPARLTEVMQPGDPPELPPYCLGSPSLKLYIKQTSLKINQHFPAMEK